MAVVRAQGNRLWLCQGNARANAQCRTALKIAGVWNSDHLPILLKAFFFFHTPVILLDMYRLCSSYEVE